MKRSQKRRIIVRFCVLSFFFFFFILFFIVHLIPYSAGWMHSARMWHNLQLNPKTCTTHKYTHRTVHIAHSIVAALFLYSLYFFLLFTVSFSSIRNILWRLLLPAGKTTQNTNKLNALTQQVGAQIVPQHTHTHMMPHSQYAPSTYQQLTIAIAIRIFSHLWADQTDAHRHTHIHQNVQLFFDFFLHFRYSWG